MARRVDKQAKAARGKRAANPADELEVLHPERQISIAGRDITVREYGFVEGLTVRALAKPLTDALYAQARAGGSAPLYTEIDDVLAQHPEMTVALLAKAADVEPEWIHRLNDEDGADLLLTWWLVNSGFFIRPLLRRLATEQLAAGRSDGGASTPTSSATGTDAPPPISES